MDNIPYHSLIDVVICMSDPISQADDLQLPDDPVLDDPGLQELLEGDTLRIDLNPFYRRQNVVKVDRVILLRRAAPYPSRRKAGRRGSWPSR